MRLKLISVNYRPPKLPSTPSCKSLAVAAVIILVRPFPGPPSSYVPFPTERNKFHGRRGIPVHEIKYVEIDIREVR